MSRFTVPASICSKLALAAVVPAGNATFFRVGTLPLEILLQYWQGIFTCKQVCEECIRIVQLQREVLLVLIKLSKRFGQYNTATYLHPEIAPMWS